MEQADSEISLAFAMHLSTASVLWMSSSARKTSSSRGYSFSKIPQSSGPKTGSFIA